MDGVLRPVKPAAHVQFTFIQPDHDMPKVHTRFVLPTLLTALIALVAAAGVTAVCAQRVGSPHALHDTGFTQALEQFRVGHHAAAYARLTRLADAGHAPSAQLALLMLRHGKTMCGAEWSASAGQQERWHALAVNGLGGLVPIVENDAGD
jgi:hypothetical protein